MAKTKDVSYRKAYKSDHLGVLDLEEMLEQGRSLVVTVKEVWYEDTSVAGNKGNFNIAYFEEAGVKPLVLNATNAATLRHLCGGGVELNTWKLPILVELYIDASVKMGREVVGGVRIKREKVEKPKLPIKDADWPKALAALEAGQFTKEQLEARDLTPAQLKELAKKVKEISEKQQNTTSQQNMTTDATTKEG